jgi:hypothetical protein
MFLIGLYSWHLGNIYILDIKITMIIDEFTNILEDSQKCIHSFEINESYSPQCKYCLRLCNWGDLKKYLERSYGEHGIIEYDSLKQKCFRARSKKKSGLILISKKYFSIELNKEIIRNFYYEKNN